MIVLAVFFVVLRHRGFQSNRTRVTSNDLKKYKLKRKYKNTTKRSVRPNESQPCSRQRYGYDTRRCDVLVINVYTSILYICPRRRRIVVFFVGFSIDHRQNLERIVVRD